MSVRWGTYLTVAWALFLFAPLACTQGSSNLPGGLGAGGAANPENTNNPQSTPPQPLATPIGVTPECPNKKSKCRDYTLTVVFVSAVEDPKKYTVSMKGHLYNKTYDPQIALAEGDPWVISPAMGLGITILLPATQEIGPITTDAEGCFLANFPGNPKDVVKLLANSSGSTELIVEGYLVPNFSPTLLPPCGPLAEQASDPSGN